MTTIIASRAANRAARRPRGPSPSWMRCDSSILHQPPSIVTHGNLLALLLRHFDGRVGFAAWEALTNPDVYRVTLGNLPNQSCVFGR